MLSIVTFSVAPFSHNTLRADDTRQMQHCSISGVQPLVRSAVNLPV